ncbi:hypothetical protein D3C84_1099060 [compost metagenome]
MESRRTSSRWALAFLRGLAGVGRLAMLTSLSESGRHRQGLTAFSGQAGLLTNGGGGAGLFPCFVGANSFAEQAEGLPLATAGGCYAAHSE